jgi:phosphate acetyltransferase
MNAMESIWDRARANSAAIVLPESGDERVVSAAGTAAREGIAAPVLVGETSAIENLAHGAGVSLEGVRIWDPATSDRLEAYGRRLFERRRHKGMEPDEAHRLAAQPLFFGALGVALGNADGIVAGAATTTADVLRAYIFSIGVAEGVQCVSSSFLMVVPSGDGDERALVFADPSVVPDPDPSELASIAVASARTMKRLTGEDPYVAMLSFSTKGSAKHPNVDKVIEATDIARRTAPEFKIDGEMQADTAIVPEVAKKKAPDSPVAGKANVLVFPNLDSANIGYKLVERLARAKAFGPLLQGLARPASDLSRGCGADDIVNTIAMTAAQKEPG